MKPTVRRTDQSPRLRSLQEDLQSGKVHALAAFWSEISEHGSPLIEPDEMSPDHSLVTFLWRDTGDTENVVVFGLWSEFDISENQNHCV